MQCARFQSTISDHWSTDKLCIETSMLSVDIPLIEMFEIESAGHKREATNRALNNKPKTVEMKNMRPTTARKPPVNIKNDNHEVR